MADLIARGPVQGVRAGGVGGDVIGKVHSERAGRGVPGCDLIVLIVGGRVVGGKAQCGQGAWPCGLLSSLRMRRPPVITLDRVP